MALKFIDSFDHYATADIGEKWDYVKAGGSGSAISAGTGRWGSRSYRCTSGNAALGKGINPDSQTAIWGAAVNIRAQTAQLPIGETYDAVNENGLVLFTANIDGSISAWRHTTGGGGSVILGVAGATLLGTSTAGVLGVGVWNYLEFKVVHHDSAGVVEVYVNGSEVLNLTSQDTLPGTLAYTMIIIGMGSSTGIIDYDDLYMADDQGGGVDDVQGDCIIGVIFPEAEGSNSDLTPSAGTEHYSLVDETSPNDDTDYLTGENVGDKDTWQYQNVSPLGTILGVQVNISARKTEAGTKTICPVYRHDGVDYDGDDIAVPAETYKYLREITEVNPGTTSAWTVSDINAAEFGVKVTA